MAMFRVHKPRKHLSIKCTDDGKATATVMLRICTGRQVSYALMGAGLYGLNGISPEVSVCITNSYVVPAVMYGLEALQLSESDYIELTNSSIYQKEHPPVLCIFCQEHFHSRQYITSMSLLSGHNIFIFRFTGVLLAKLAFQKKYIIALLPFFYLRQ